MTGSVYLNRPFHDWLLGRDPDLLRALLVGPIRWGVAGLILTGVDAALADKLADRRDEWNATVSPPAPFRLR